MASSEGNVPPPGTEQDTAPPEDIRAGDLVALTPQALRMGRLEGMCVRQLCAIGWDNSFPVTGVFDSPEDGKCVTLWPCCFHLKDRKRGTPVYRCKGHPAIYFTKVGRARMPSPSDRKSAITLPFGLGQAVDFNYEGDPENPKFTGNLFGLEGSCTGGFAKLFESLFGNTPPQS